MFTFETADQKEAQRFRNAQFNARAVTITTNGGSTTGNVQSVQKVLSSVPPRWSITIVPSPSKAERAAMRPPLALMEDAR